MYFNRLWCGPDASYAGHRPVPAWLQNTKLSPVKGKTLTPGQDAETPLCMCE
jgi:hypothetical protein